MLTIYFLTLFLSGLINHLYLAIFDDDAKYGQCLQYGHAHLRATSHNAGHYVWLGGVPLE